MQDDRRKFIRYDIPLEVEFRKFDDSSEYSSGTAINFSRSGMCFSSGNAIQNVNEVVDLRVKLPERDSFVSAIGDVVWKEKLDNACLYGVKLMAMEAEAKSVILDNAYNMWLETMRS